MILDELLARLERVKRSGSGWTARCPAHEDRNPSLAVAEGDDGRVLVKCHAGCTAEAITAALGLELADLFTENGTQSRGGDPEAVYTYVDEYGHALFEVCRFPGKEFRQRKPAADDWGIRGVRRVLYRTDRLFTARETGQADTVYLVEGEKDVHALERAGALATTNPMGAGKWRPEYAEQLAGFRRAIVVADGDEPGRTHAAEVARSLADVVDEVAVVGTAAGKDAADHLAAGRGLDEFVPLSLDERGRKVDEGPAPSLAEVLDLVRGYLSLEPGEERHIVAALSSAVAAELDDEEPLWLMLVGPSGGGKTEAIRLLDGVVDRRVDELTRAGLLSWSLGGKPKQSGLLTRIPAVALVTFSDFSTVATMGDREARARIYGAFRVVYDGSLYRGIGGEPASEGKASELEWQGHVTLIAGATPAIDAHSSFEAALGERWLTVRQPESKAGRKRARALYAVGRSDVPGRREQAREAATSLVRAARKRIPADLPPDLVERLADVATFCATARTGVVYEGQGRSRVVLGLPTPEEPTRLLGQLVRLARCATALGLLPDVALELAVSAAFDSVPLARLRALRCCADTHLANVTDVWKAIGRGNRYGAKWELDALEAIGLVIVIGPSEDDDPKAERHYVLADEWREVYESVGSLYSRSLL